AFLWFERAQAFGYGPRVCELMRRERGAPARGEPRQVLLRRNRRQGPRCRTRRPAQILEVARPTRAPEIAVDQLVPRHEVVGIVRDLVLEKRDAAIPSRELGIARARVRDDSKEANQRYQSGAHRSDPASIVLRTPVTWLRRESHARVFSTTRRKLK